MIPEIITFIHDKYDNIHIRGDTKKLVERLIAQRPAMEAAGWRYETETELETRKALHRQQQEMELRRIENLFPKS